MDSSPAFVVATPARSVCDENARALHKNGSLRFIALGTKTGIAGVPAERTRLNPKIGLVAYAAAKMLPVFQAESLRFRLNPWFDRWVEKQLVPGNHILSSYGYANASFRWVRENGGKTFLDGGNSHPKNFWNVLLEEHKRWNCNYPPIASHQQSRALEMMEHVDYVLSPSSHVTNSFLENGFRSEQILRNVYPVNVACFNPPVEPRAKNRPFTMIAPGMLSLRKGTPYLLEAYRAVLKKIPSARLVLIKNIFENVAEVVRKNSDLPITWLPPLTAEQLAEQMRQADVLILSSLEEGFARIIIEAWACGLPAIVTPNTGAADYIVSGKNGDVVPIRDAKAITEAALKWAELTTGFTGLRQSLIDPSVFSVEHFERDFIDQLRSLGLVSGAGI